MFCSIVIPTVARPSLSKAVQSALKQDFNRESFEVIVVNDSGRPLPAQEWHSHPQVRVISTHKRERSIARNTGAAIARGKYLYFLDDDDWLDPGTLQAFHEVAQKSQAGWLYGCSQLLDRQENPIIQLNPSLPANCFIHVMAGEWIPLQSSMILAEAFFSVGGFKPLMYATQDIDISRRIALRWEFCKVDKIAGFISMGVEGSRTDYSNAHKYSREGREAILNQRGVFMRMRDSANGPYWDGRIVRAFATSLIWNLGDQRLLTAISRGVYTAIGLLLTFPSIFTMEYWAAIFQPYDSFTFRDGFERENITVTRREVQTARRGR